MASADFFPVMAAAVWLNVLIFPSWSVAMMPTGSRDIKRPVKACTWLRVSCAMRYPWAVRRDNHPPSPTRRRVTDMKIIWNRLPLMAFSSSSMERPTVITIFPFCRAGLKFIIFLHQSPCSCVFCPTAVSLREVDDCCELSGLGGELSLLLKLRWRAR